MCSKYNAAERIVADFIEALANADNRAMERCLADDLQSYITNAQGGVNHLAGRLAFMESISALDVKAVGPSIAITQMLSVKADQVLVMVEIKAERKGRKLHNFAAFLIDIEDGAIAGLRMVEARPAYSDAFWKD